jgi:hypothetical protein
MQSLFFALCLVFCQAAVKSARCVNIPFAAFAIRRPPSVCDAISPYHDCTPKRPPLDKREVKDFQRFRRFPSRFLNKKAPAGAADRSTGEGSRPRPAVGLSDARAAARFPVGPWGCRPLALKFPGFIPSG